MLAQKGLIMEEKSSNSNPLTAREENILERRIKLAARSDSATSNHLSSKKAPALWKRLFLRKTARYSGEYSIFYYMYKSLFLCYFSIKGRASRREFWALTLLSLMLNMLCFYWFYVRCDDFEKLLISLSWISKLTFIPGITIIIRRVHDFGKSGWWLFIPTYKIIFFAFIKGDQGENAFGKPE